MREKTTKKVKKLIDIANFVYAHPGRTADELAELLDVSHVELNRAIETLSVCGVPPYSPENLFDAYIEEDGRVYLTHPDRFFEHPVRLSRSEALALLAAGKAAMRGASAGGDLASALDKVRAAMAPGESSEVERIAERLDIAPETANLRPLLETLRDAAGREEIDIDYFTPARGEISRRTVRPYGLVYDIDRWYLVGWCRLRRRTLVFRVDRIKSARRNGRAFSIPADFDLSEFRRKEMFQFIERPHKVRVRLADAADTPLKGWPSVKTIETANGTEIEFGVDRLEGMVGPLLAAAGRATPVQPPELGELLREAARRALALYEH